MNLLKNMVNFKVNMITGNELLKYANQFNIQLSKTEAEKIATYLRGKNFDIFDERIRTKIIREVAKITGPKTAKEINKLMVQFTAG
ncbi:DUF2624 domain-containing protein [Siminovitchia sp. FSL H7-0308]|uniref:Wobble nucleotide-excising tRNase n=1 Tax=Siminovitchia thermophila TaxID=1245522 RepID=A0ABS2R9J2_9BACI|nr:DUF2624 domain-containing protein [Siminovitchia thermophila]MBM7716279.1 wobble nucleotide-excising tRNase [Siminovitchia thermophila]ONK24226.1 tRNA methyltransferase [Bacillus sp. VT-16-64]